jgi:AcrR family transcriptional regulator
MAARVEGISPAAQQERRRRMMDIAIDLVIREGYDGLKVRRVAALAQVSTRTLYNHFPSKEHLLLSALVERGESGTGFLGRRPPTGRTPAQRVRNLLAVATAALQAVPALASGMTKALVSGDPAVVPLLVEFDKSMRNAVATAIRPEGPTEADTRIARALQRIWFAALVGWSSGIDPPQSVEQAVDEGVALLLPSERKPRRTKSLP